MHCASKENYMDSRKIQRQLNKMYLAKQHRGRNIRGHEGSQILDNDPQVFRPIWSDLSGPEGKCAAGNGISRSSSRGGKS